jgi:hypothetical protein
VGITPGRRVRRALLAVCADLDARGTCVPYAYAAAPAAPVGGVDARAALASVHAALGGSNDTAWTGTAGRVAAGVVRSLAFERTFGAADRCAESTALQAMATHDRATGS